MSIASQPIIELSQPLNHEQSKIEPKKTKKSKKSKKILVKKGQWSSQEDKLLEQWVKTNGPKNWEACGRFIQGRKGKQCRVPTSFVLPIHNRASAQLLCEVLPLGDYSCRLPAHYLLVVNLLYSTSSMNASCKVSL